MSIFALFVFCENIMQRAIVADFVLSLGKTETIRPGSIVVIRNRPEQ